MQVYDEEFVAKQRPELQRNHILDIKEDIDDYLEDVQYRVVDRLNEVHELKVLLDYGNMDINRLVDKMNSVSVEERIYQLVKRQF